MHVTCIEITVNMLSGLLI